MKLPEKMLLAIAMYFANRGLLYDHDTITSNGQRVTIATRNKRTWDKDADLRRLDKACAATPSSDGYTASAGSFWFNFKGRKARYYMSGKTFPNLVRLKKGQLLPD